MWFFAKENLIKEIKVENQTKLLSLQRNHTTLYGAELLQKFWIKCLVCGYCNCHGPDLSALACPSSHLPMFCVSFQLM